MKKILSLGVASAICALTAISASAAPATWDAPKGEITKGSTITIDVLATEDINGVNFNVDVQGLELQSVEAKNTVALGGHLTAGNKWYASNGASPVAKAGDVLCTITAKITAEAGQPVSISLVSTDAKTMAILPEAAWTETVKGATSTPGTSTPGTSTPGTSTPGTSTPGTSTPGTSTPSTPGTNPPTGVALAVVPAVLAAAGVIVAKKRK